MTARRARRAALSSAALLALLASSPASAQAVRSSADPMSRAEAIALAETAVASCASMGLPATARVVDDHGLDRAVVTVDRMPEAGLIATAKKAAAVVDFRSSTADLTARLGTDSQFAGQYGQDGRYQFGPGGFPLYRGDDLVGALAMDGAKGKDSECALRAIKGLGWASVAPASGARATGPEAGELVYFGNHGEDLYGARFNGETGRLTPLGKVARMDRPTWFAVHPTLPVLYAVNESGNDGKSEGGVTSLAPDLATGRLRVINKVGSGGGGATHLAIDGGGGTIIVSNFGTGHVSAVPIEADGSLGPVASRFQEVGSGPHVRQPSAHAHGAVVDPSGRYVLSADMGADRIFVYRLDPATHGLTHLPKSDVVTPAGTGPRHVVFSPDGRFVFAMTELTAEVQSYRWDARTGRLTLIQNQPASAAAYSGFREGAEILPSRDGRFVYVSVRGENVLVTYSVEAATGKLTEVQRVSAAGLGPWSFALDPSERWLLVANEPSNAVVVFKRDPATGTLTATGESMPMFKPVAVSFFPEKPAPGPIAARNRR